MCWEGRYSTHIHISVIWFWGEGVKGKTQSSVPSRPPGIWWTTSLCLHRYERGKPRSPRTWHTDIPDSGSAPVTSQSPEYYLKVVLRFYCPSDYPQIFLFSTKMAVWQNSVPRCNVSDVSVLSMRVEGDASTHSPACPRRRSSSSSSACHHLPPHAPSFTWNNHPYSWRSLLHPNVFEIVKKHGVIFS